jgi:hypothetical protein
MKIEYERAQIQQTTSMNIIIIVTVISAVLTMTAAGKIRDGAPCNTTVQCSSHGTCEGVEGAAKYCICYDGYMNDDCSYKQFSKDTMGGLQIGLPFVGICGIANIIIGNTSRGTAQLCLGLIVWIIACPAACIMGCAAAAKSAKSSFIAGGIIGSIVCGCLLTGSIWSIVDGAAMLRGEFMDGNGYPLV